MFKKLVYLPFLATLLQGITALQQLTENNRVLFGYVFKRLHTGDWLNCIQACQDEASCISYNYDRASSGNGLCELNECGLEVTCDRDGSLIYSAGFLFQQIRRGKVS